MGERLRAGIVGHGGHGNYGHQIDAGFAAEPRVLVAAVADPDPETRAASAARTRAQRQYESWAEMLSHEDLDLVLVCPRWIAGHEEVVVAALRAGAHVYCEKPLGQDLAQVDRMLAEADRAGRLLATALPAVHEPRFRRFTDLLASGELGEPLQMRGLCKWDHRAGGEDLFVLGGHLADAMRRIGGDAVTCAGYVGTGTKPFTRQEARQGAEEIGLVGGDRVHATYTFERGLVGTIESWPCAIEDRAEQPYRLEVHCTRGIAVLRAPYADGSVWYTRKPVVYAGHDDWCRLDTRAPESYAGYHAHAAADFVDAVLEGRPPACSGRDGAAAIEMLHAIYWSHLDGQLVRLPLDRRWHPLSEVDPRTTA
ncbi:putative dehydrogenase [Amycolatopsis bartoniae]|uniref:1-carboxy-3-chloro-3,4-dihydroxycyclo hexa-1,5-diene dehydrogenase n=1 Tax=Amycolatopsis bartoniae TaxID=941986 RepID=A0A8H9IY39_9PSEU|nr:Gfo/Idh/MocA family oxidoreductase [Amycolatopsis bartoniae]MBB2935542.1 putative dehydrogenase [Amycolatopsis bartoniae]TVT05269.1 Gfo/Idh/MocA family oxidoreductase [Amycolatopsis bartoniae]GHF76656.1 1-carboxy-3-chloro-3,4-dihydroxycyclo hexa-1,5-diene dehydrogenase [Amycolatopsis bartoniae]